MKQRLLLSILFISIIQCCYSQDTLYIKVHFLYGSKPKKQFRNIERKWFGGKLGGHVGIEIAENKILNFVPKGKFHKIAKPDDRHSKFVIHDTKSFWEIFGTREETVKKATLVIPITTQQKIKLDSISTTYLTDTPYDYAFLGMRCGAAASDILSQIGILKSYSLRKTYLKIFYPKKLRKRLFKKAIKNNWKIYRQEGWETREWEKR